MRCEACYKDYPEYLIQESHDVPCYLFFLEAMHRKERKKFADKYPRRWLCSSCHAKYKLELRDHFIQCALQFSAKWRLKNED